MPTSGGPPGTVPPRCSGLDAIHGRAQQEGDLVGGICFAAVCDAARCAAAIDARERSAAKEAAAGAAACLALRPLAGRRSVAHHPGWSPAAPLDSLVARRVMEKPTPRHLRPL